MSYKYDRKLHLLNLIVTGGMANIEQGIDVSFKFEVSNFIIAKAKTVGGHTVFLMEPHIGKNIQAFKQSVWSDNRGNSDDDKSSNSFAMSAHSLDDIGTITDV
jgi:hypothetical protein